MTIMSTETENEVVCEAVGCQSKANVEVHLLLIVRKSIRTVTNGFSLLDVTIH